jgi:hypothetical protein
LLQDKKVIKDSFWCLNGKVHKTAAITYWKKERKIVEAGNITGKQQG